MEVGLKTTTNLSTTLHDGDVTWSTTADPLTPVEEDAIVTMVVVVIGVMIAIIALFCMGIFIDCRKTESDLVKRRHPLRLKIGRRRGNNRVAKSEDNRSFADDMCPNGISNPGPSDTGANYRGEWA